MYGNAVTVDSLIEFGHCPMCDKPLADPGLVCDGGSYFFKNVICEDHGTLGLMYYLETRSIVYVQGGVFPYD